MYKTFSVNSLVSVTININVVCKFILIKPIPNVVSSERLLIKSSQGQQINEKRVRQSRKEKYDADWK
jgi:hypothetical protein